MTHVHVANGMWRGARRLTTLPGAMRTVRAAPDRFILWSSPCAFERVGFGSHPRFYSATSSSSGSQQDPTASLVDSLEEASAVMVRDSDLLQAVGSIASNGTGDATTASSLAVVQAVQTLIETVHVTTGLPWWATLAATGVVFRAAVFPFYLLQMKATQRLVQAKTDFTKVISAYRFARTFIPKGNYDEHVKAMLLGKKGYELVLKKYDTRPVQTVLGSLVHIPLFIVVAYSARDMIRSGNVAGLETGGLWLWTNLQDVDGTYTLPVLASGSVFLNLEVSRRTRSSFWSDVLGYFQFAPIFALPMIATLPQGVFFYWIASSWASLGQTLLLQNNAFRRRVGLPPRGDLAEAPTALPQLTEDTEKSSAPKKPVRKS